MSEYHPDDERNIMVNELRVIEFIDKDGQLNTVDLSQASGGEELVEKSYLNVIMWALAFALAPKVAAVLAGMDADADGG